jgi:uncharacterized membrane protein
MSPLTYFPHPPLLLLLVAAVIAILGLVLRFVLVDYAYERIGLSRSAAWLVLLSSLLGSSINLPVTDLRAEHITPARLVEAHGLMYVVPPLVHSGHTVVAVNLGGAIIPLLLVGYLVLRFGIGWRGLGAVAAVAVAVHAIARPVHGVGIVLPSVLLPGLLAGATAMLMDPWSAPRTAFIAGTVGTLLGADLMNFDVFADLGAPVVSIGGAGTFDGIFVTGVVAVLLAGLARGRRDTSTKPQGQDAPPPPHDVPGPHE